MCPNCGIALSRYQGVEYGNITITPICEVKLENRIVNLTTNQRIMVDSMIRAEGRPLSRDTLLMVLDKEDMESRTVDIMIVRIRNQFKEAFPAFNQIRCVRQVGYQWVKQPLGYLNRTVELRLVA